MSDTATVVEVAPKHDMHEWHYEGDGDRFGFQPTTRQDRE